MMNQDALRNKFPFQPIAQEFDTYLYSALLFRLHIIGCCGALNLCMTELGQTVECLVDRPFRNWIHITLTTKQ